MTYDETLAHTWTRKEALIELAKHGVEPGSQVLGEFFDEVGDKQEYSGKEILDWLGY